MEEIVQIVYNGATAKLENLPERFISYISQELTFYDKNKGFQANRSANSFIDPYVRLFNLKTKSFPTGLIPRVCNLLNLLEVQYKIKKNLDEINPVDWEIPSVAYPHQIEIVENALKARRCQIQSPTGSGKTFAASFFLAHFPFNKCLFIVPKKSLLYQTVAVLEKILDEPIGVIGDGKRKWERVTVGIINTLSILAKQKSKELKGIQVLVVDECHLAGSSMYKKVSNYCVNTDFRLALSATLKRQSGDDLVIEGLYGPVVLQVPPDVLVAESIIHKPTYLVVPFHHNKEEVFPKAKVDATGNPIRHFGRVLYNTVDEKPLVIDVQQQAIGQNGRRNHLIIDILHWFLESKKKTGGCLILVEYKKHAQSLIDIARDKYDISLPFCSGDQSARQVEKLVKDLSDGKYPAMIATRVLNEGKDIRPIELVIIASGGAGGNKIIQQVGRGVRTSPETGKVRSLIVDFTDEDAPFYLTRQAQKRHDAIAREYKDCIKNVSLEELKNLL